jgi:hypothetical protein
MTVLHTGSTKRFASGWEAVFSGSKNGRAIASQTAVKKVKKPAGKKTKGAKKAAKGRSK